MTLLCDDSGLKFGAWRKPDSYLGGAKSESCKTGSFFFLQPWRCRLLLLFAPILHRSEPHFQIRMETQFILAQKTEAIGENGDFFSSPMVELQYILAWHLFGGSCEILELFGFLLLTKTP